MKATNTKLVVDASLLLAVWLNEEHSRAAWQVLADNETAELAAPVLLASEFANALAMRERANRIAPDQVYTILDEFKTLGVTLIADVALLQSGAVTLAREYRLTAYDAAYLGLAVRERAPLASLDTALRAAARKAGVEVLPKNLN